MRTHEVSRIRPVTIRDSNTVVAWIFRLTLREGEQSAFDEITVEQQTQRPLDEWRKGDVGALVTEAVARHPRARALHETLNARLAIEERAEFDVNSLRE